MGQFHKLCGNRIVLLPPNCNVNFVGTLETLISSVQFSCKTLTWHLFPRSGFQIAGNHGEIFRKRGMEGEMKKLLAFTLTVFSFGFLGLGFAASEAKASTVTAPQIRIELGQRNRGRGHYRRVREVRQTRIVQRGWRRYRETYLVRYFPNGQTQTTLISRERIS
jgi:hypothetical protein